MSVFTLLIDVDNKRILSNRFGGVGNLPNFDRGDSPSFEVGFLKYNGVQYDFVDYANASIKFGIGVNAATPSEGQFRLTWNGVTSNAITYNATTAEVQTALAPVVSASVTTACETDSAWIITTTTQGIFTGTTAGLGGDAFTLYPQSSVLINTVRSAAPGVSMRQVVRLVQTPAAYQDSWSNSSTTGGATLTLTQQGSASQSETYSLEIDDSVYAGQYNLIFGNQTAGISFDATAEQIQNELAKLTSIGTYLDANGVTQPNVRVSGSNGKYGIAFVGNLSQTNVTTSLTINDTALFRPPYKTAVVTLGTGQIESLLNCGVTGLTLEVEIIESGKSNTVLSESVTFNRNDLIVTGSAVPAQQASYYTKAEADALFVEDSTSNVDASNKTLVGNNLFGSIDWGERYLLDSSSNTVFDWANGVGFYGTGSISKPSGSNFINSVTNLGLIFYTTPTGSNLISSITATGIINYTAPTGSNLVSSITATGILSYTAPTQANVVSNLVSAGLFASSATYGVLPGSSKTLTTTASLYFGLVGSNSTNSVSVTVTGCNLNDIVLLGLPASMDNGIAFAGHVTTANGIEIDCINATNGNITPATATYRITVIGY